MYHLQLRILGLVLTFFLLLPLFPAGAADYPTKTINLVIPYPPGGSTDLTARSLANAAKKYLGQPLICENKSGGGGTVGPSLVVTRPADGYTIGVITAAATIAWHMGKMNYNPIEDQTHIIRWAGYLFGVVVRADAPWKTFQELIQYAKQNPQKVSYGSPGVGTPPQLAMEELGMAAGVQWVHIPSKGIAENNTAMLGGHIDVISDSSGWAPLVDAGKFRLLATYGFDRSARYPKVPTVKESGFDVVCPGPIGMMGPKGMPKPIVNRLHDAFKKGLDDPDFLSVMQKFDMNTLYQNPEDYDKFVHQDSARIESIVKKLGLYKK